jgi:hypothetical protein
MERRQIIDNINYLGVLKDDPEGKRLLLHALRMLCSVRASKMISPF